MNTFSSFLLCGQTNFLYNTNQNFQKILILLLLFICTSTAVVYTRFTYEHYSCMIWINVIFILIILYLLGYLCFTSLLIYSPHNLSFFNFKMTWNLIWNACDNNFFWNNVLQQKSHFGVYVCTVVVPFINNTLNLIFVIPKRTQSSYQTTQKMRGYLTMRSSLKKLRCNG